MHEKIERSKLNSFPTKTNQPHSGTHTFCKTTPNFDQASNFPPLGLTPQVPIFRSKSPLVTPVSNLKTKSSFPAVKLRKPSASQLSNAAKKTAGCLINQRCSNISSLFLGCDFLVQQSIQYHLENYENDNKVVQWHHQSLKRLRSKSEENFKIPPLPSPNDIEKAKIATKLSLQENLIQEMETTCIPEEFEPSESDTPHDSAESSKKVIIPEPKSSDMYLPKQDPVFTLKREKPLNAPKFQKIHPRPLFKSKTFVAENRKIVKVRRKKSMQDDQPVEPEAIDQSTLKTRSLKIGRIFPKCIGEGPRNWVKKSL